MDINKNDNSVNNNEDYEVYEPDTNPDVFYTPENSVPEKNTCEDTDYQPNWRFANQSESSEYYDSDSAVIKDKKQSGVKYVLISVLCSVLFTVFICSLMFLYLTKFSKSNITGKENGLVIFRDGDDLREKIDINETLASLASDSSNILTTQQIARQVGPAVVGIVSSGETDSYYFYSTPYQSGGSGVIISEDGYIVTNNHVIEGAKQITVILNTKEEYAAKVVGTDARTDLAVLKIEASDLTWASLGNSGSVQVGEPVVAIGNPLGMELAGTVTKGIISATNRTIEVEGQTFVLLQTDAAVNSGNSGGALVNAYGEVIGINSAKLKATGVEGLSFAIPSDVAKPIIQDLIETGYVKGRPIIGIIGDEISKEEAKAYSLQEGILVMSIAKDSAAHKAGIQRGDIIIKCQGEEVKTVEELNLIRDRYKAGDEITLTVIRDDNPMDIPLVLGEEIQAQQ